MANLRQIVDGRALQAYGTSEGVTKSWDTRGRAGFKQAEDKQWHSGPKGTGVEVDPEGNQRQKMGVEWSREGRGADEMGTGMKRAGLAYSGEPYADAARFTHPDGSYVDVERGGKWRHWDGASGATYREGSGFSTLRQHVTSKYGRR